MEWLVTRKSLLEWEATLDLFVFFCESLIDSVWINIKILSWKSIIIKQKLQSIRALKIFDTKSCS